MAASQKAKLSLRPDQNINHTFQQSLYENPED